MTVKELDQVQPALTTFVLADEGLGPAQAPSKVDLPDASCLPAGPHGCKSS